MRTFCYPTLSYWGTHDIPLSVDVLVREIDFDRY